MLSVFAVCQPTDSISLFQLTHPVVIRWGSHLLYTTVAVNTHRGFHWGSFICAVRHTKHPVVFLDVHLWCSSLFHQKTNGHIIICCCSPSPKWRRRLVNSLIPFRKKLSQRTMHDNDLTGLMYCRRCRLFSFKPRNFLVHQNSFLKLT